MKKFEIVVTPSAGQLVLTYDSKGIGGTAPVTFEERGRYQGKYVESLVVSVLDVSSGLCDCCQDWGALIPRLVQELKERGIWRVYLRTEGPETRRQAMKLVAMLQPKRLDIHVVGREFQLSDVDELNYGQVGAWPKENNSSIRQAVDADWQQYLDEEGLSA